MAESEGRAGAASPSSGWVDYAEDATGFGSVEWRTARDLLIRPRDVLDAYVAGGPTGFGQYARPTRFYLALCGVLTFYLFLIGGNQRLLADVPPALIDALGRWSGKGRAGFVAGADGWLGLTVVPVLAAFYTLGLSPFIRWWGGYRWRIAFRATLAMLSAGTVPMLALGPLPYLDRFKLAGSVLVYAMVVAGFVRTGRGVWWTSVWGAIGKSVVVVVTLAIAASIGMMAVLALTAVGVRFGA